MKSKSGETIEEGWWLIYSDAGIEGLIESHFGVVRITENFVYSCGTSTTMDYIPKSWNLIRSLDLEKIANEKQ